MEKVKVTQEQAEAIRIAVIDYGSDMVLLDRFRGGGSGVIEVISPVVLAKALYIGYEVEPEFNYGDWVVTNAGNITRVKCTGTFEYNGALFLEGYTSQFFASELRHATTEEIAKENTRKTRRWWESHNRDVGELSCGDILTNKRGSGSNAVYVVTKVHNDGSVTLDARDNWTVDELLEQCYVVCFAEDRKDIKS